MELLPLGSIEREGGGGGGGRREAERGGAKMNKILVSEGGPGIREDEMNGGLGSVASGG